MVHVFSLFSISGHLTAVIPDICVCLTVAGERVYGIIHFCTCGTPARSVCLRSADLMDRFDQQTVSLSLCAALRQSTHRKAFSANRSP